MHQTAGVRRHLTSPPQNKKYSAHWNMPASLLGAWATSPGAAVGSVGGRSMGGVRQDTSDQVTIHVRLPYHVVGLVVGPTNM